MPDWGTPRCATASLTRKAKVIIVGDVGFRRGKTVDLKAIVDEAIDTLEFVEKVVVYARRPTELNSKREIDFNDLLKFPADCPAEEMDAEDPLFLLYTSGSTGKPKGVVHVHGGYMVATTYYLESFYDVGEQDIFWCTSDIGWVVATLTSFIHRCARERRRCFVKARSTILTQAPRGKSWNATA